MFTFRRGSMVSMVSLLEDGASVEVDLVGHEGMVGTICLVKTVPELETALEQLIVPLLHKSEELEKSYQDWQVLWG
jgi:hypothetical protein